jgi:opacity protein-like surface antigen
MKKSVLLIPVCVFASVSAWSSEPPDAVIKKSQEADAPFSWTGGYIGLNVGYSWNSSAADYSVLGGGLFPNPSGTFGLPAKTGFDSRGITGGAQAGYNYQIGRIVFGPELDISSLDQSRSLTASGKDDLAFPYIASKAQSLDWLGTGRFRLGVTPTGRLLIYGTGGVAYGHTSESTRTVAQGIEIFNTSLFGLNNSSSISGTRVGPAIGAGAEYALSDRLSAKIEYLHYDLGDAVVAGAPDAATLFSPNRSNTRFDLNGQILHAGLNYQIDPLFSGFAAANRDTPVLSLLSDLQTEFGSRYWVSSGKTLKYLCSPSGAFINSQLTYDGLVASSAELYARTEHVSGFFLKGNIGTGEVTGGSLRDEDFPPVVGAYSSTASSQKDGSITYGTVDAGYDFLNRGTYKLGAFLGYNYYHEIVNADGCQQTVGGTACEPAIPDTVRGITNDGQWNSARLGLNGEIMPTQRLKLTADVAWLPYTSLSSQDVHWLRTNAFGGFTGPVPDDGIGHDGYQLESILSYQVTGAFSLGIGGRYWFMETSGKSNFEGNVTGGGGVAQPVDFTTKRFGGFVQASYRF